MAASGRQYPPLVALHGAGLDVASPFWTNAISRQKYNWVIYPSGLSYWGYDWRGPSALDVFGSVNALRMREPGIAEHIVVIGHSNGGQGAFFIASRHPDLVPAAIPVAAYLSASAYVPLSFSHGSHYADPALEGILRASTAGGDNDLFLGNLTRSRLRTFHGGDDENVPAWQSRKAAEIVKSFDNVSDAT
jgi:pimeloyl-ACP methyl ester carboxylesterase